MVVCLNWCTIISFVLLDNYWLLEVYTSWIFCVNRCRTIRINIITLTTILDRDFNKLSMVKYYVGQILKLFLVLILSLLVCKVYSFK